MLNILKEFMKYAVDRGMKFQTISTSGIKTNDVILFVKDGLRFLFSYNESQDPYFFQISLPYIDDYDNENNPEWQINCIRRLSLEYKTGKALVHNDNHIWLTFEQYVYSDVNISKLFEQGIGCLESMIKDYREEQMNHRKID